MRGLRGSFTPVRPNCQKEKKECKYREAGRNGPRKAGKPRRCGLILKFPKALPSWFYRDPADTVQFEFCSAPMQFVQATAATQRHAALGDEISRRQKRVRIWDQHYRQARRLHVKQLMRGKR